MTSPLIGSAWRDHARLGDGRVAHQRALHLRSADAEPRYAQHIVRTTEDHEEAVLIAHRHIARRKSGRGSFASIA